MLDIEIADVDLAIEAVFEDLEVKKAVFKELDRVCKRDAVLAINTFYLAIDGIAGAARGLDGCDFSLYLPACRLHRSPPSVDCSMAIRS